MRKATMDDISKVFGRMMPTYGKLWESQFNNSPELFKAAKEAWFAEVKNKGYSAYALDAAYWMAIDHHRDYPPTLPQFSYFCAMVEKSEVFKRETMLTRKEPQGVSFADMKLDDLRKVCDDLKQILPGRVPRACVILKERENASSK